MKLSLSAEINNAIKFLVMMAVYSLILLLIFSIEKEILRNI